MNITTQNDHKVNQLDENIKVVAEKSLYLIYSKYYPAYISMRNTDSFKQELFDIIKQNIEGNVNWVLGD